jgi:hypothetical protein
MIYTNCSQSIFFTSISSFYFSMALRYLLMESQFPKDFIDIEVIKSIIPSIVDSSKLSLLRKQPHILKIKHFDLEDHILACFTKPGWVSDTNHPTIVKAYNEGKEITDCMELHGSEVAKKLLSDLVYQIHMM